MSVNLTLYFWTLRVCPVTKEIKEMLAFLVHRYYFCCQSFAKDRSLQLLTSAVTLTGVSVNDICPCSLTCLEVTIIEAGDIDFSVGTSGSQFCVTRGFPLCQWLCVEAMVCPREAGSCLYNFDSFLFLFSLGCPWRCGFTRT